ncbi:MAG: outer membrane protein assembly factor BamA [Helicobacter sp.]|uniref:outer membrane protein assembly factor BamA n=1 Tax=Helicobacter sp. 10-6591 TaxID=2004998 RepID=UPI00215D1A77|nr:outer membrane protein assembly factor BamA [Helicobacter sp. 10-6591]MCI6218202.1 outer membrane protein assembly factor BamA [Helicobacter sp.]MCI7484897.1 outer membrane protein assembly factor BamA [Helicobacter sp.]MDD7568097.1 outer membrane protein assembly factor BamA [Helicobacter sp.]MDY5741295.1 outer membrane protein assembly factor BamA [Helicobacter sp.]
MQTFIKVFFYIFMASVVSTQFLKSEQIKAIKYEGSHSISDVLAGEISKIKPGDELDIKAVDKAVAEFFKQGYFEDVYTTFENGVLTFHFKQRPKIASVEIKGYGNEQEKETLYSQIGIKKGDSFDEIKLERAKTVIKMILEYQGYYGSVINHELKPVGSGEAYAITLHINQGDNIIITKAHYEGREKLSVSEIEELTANRQKQFAGWLWGRNDGKLRLNDLEFDSARIQDAYMRKGFLDANVTPAFLQVNSSDYTAELYYKIKEGERYKVISVEISLQMPVIAEKKLRKNLKVKKGKYFNIEELRADLENIRQEVADLGYAFARVSPDLDKDPKSSEVKVIYYVQVGQKVKINDVIITGNTRTGDRIIRRELLLAPGDEYSLTKLIRSQNALRRLGYFNKVDIQERRVSENSMDLLVNVEEARTGELMFGFGYGSFDRFMVNASIRERNLFGTGHSAQFYVDWSTRRELFNITLTNPRIFDSGYSESVSAFVSTYNNWDYREQTRGVSLTFGRLLTDTFSVSLGYTISTTKILGFYSDITYFLYNQYFSRTYKNGITPLDGPIKSSISPSISFDNTDDYYFPKNGIIASAYVEYAGLGGGEKYTKIYGKFAAYKHLKNLIGLDFIARYKTQAGMIIDQGYTPITSKFYMGGISSVRGYQVSSLTPRFPDNLSGIRIGGNYILTNSVELSYGLLQKAQMRIAVFADHGMIGVDSLQETERASWGIAVEWVSPLGPIVLVFPQAINPREQDFTSKFEFTMGTRF